MSKRRDFLKKSLLGTTGIALGALGSCKSSTADKAASAEAPVQAKDWHTDPEWSKVKYGSWGGPGVSAGPGPMDQILVKDWAPRSLVVTKENFVPKPKYPAIDCHVHVVAKTQEEIADWVKTMDEVGMETSVVLTGLTGKSFDDLVEQLPKKYPGRFLLYCGLDRTDVDKPDWPKRAVAELERCYSKGARGVGELSDKGWGFTRQVDLAREKRLHPDDNRMDPFWQKCAELKMPVNLHVADHPSCWTPLDVYQERTPDYQHFNQYGKDVPSFDELIQIRNRTLEKHPKTTFVACHLGNLGHNLEMLSQTMDKYPNLYLDTSARDYEMGRTPKASAAFLSKYKDRIVFGTDQGREKSMYQVHWRLFETDDEYFEGRVSWRYYGMKLPDKVLEAVYRGTARKIFNFKT